MNKYTADLPDAFFSGLNAICHDIGCAPADILAVMQNESGIRPDAHNPNGDASGLVQFMPFILTGLGWTQGHAAFRKLSAVEQLPYVRKYFWPHRGLLVNGTAVYLATFLPACLSHASEPDYQLVVKDGRLGWAYAPNIGFDADHNGVINVRELGDAVDRAAARARCVEAVQRAAACAATPPDLGPVAADPTADVIEDNLPDYSDLADTPVD